MSRTGMLAAFSSIGLAALVMPAPAADVTQQRLLNAPGPQDWLMVHRDFGSPATPAERQSRQRRDLKLKFGPIGGTATGAQRARRSTPLVDSGFMCVRHLEPGVNSTRGIGCAVALRSEDHARAQSRARDV